MIDSSDDLCGSSTSSSTAILTKRKQKKKNIKKIITTPFQYTFHIKEDHKKPIFAAQFNHSLTNKNIFATVGSNRISVYECLPNGQITLVETHEDPNSNEVFYTCAWSSKFDAKQTNQPILAVAGLQGVIRVFCMRLQTCIIHFTGHGHAINELKFHPIIPYFLLSASKDHSLRLWNIKTGICVAIFGGDQGHRDEVLGADFDLKGEKFISCGMDHSLKLWRLDKPEIKHAMIKSSTIHDTSGYFKTFREHFPDFSTRDIHRNYVDCVLWFGNFIFSKSCENRIVCWKIVEHMQQYNFTKKKKKPKPVHHFKFTDCDIWFMRFSKNYFNSVMALGSQNGKVFIWELDSTDLKLTKCNILSHPKCTSPIRQTAFSKDGKMLICVCDDGNIWRWDKIM